MVKVKALPPVGVVTTRVGKQRSASSHRAGEHVDDAGLRVGVDLEEELAQPVYDLVTAVDESQLARELGRPLGQLLDV